MSSPIALQPPQPALEWTHTPEQVLQEMTDAIADAVARLDKVAALEPDQCTFESVFLALAEGEAKTRAIFEPLFLYQHVATSKELRDASTKAEELAQDYKVDASMRLDVFRAKQAAAKNITAAGKPLSSEEQRLVDKMLLEGTRSGLALPECEREVMSGLQKELAQACQQYSKDYGEDNSVISFTPSQLDGVPEDIISGFSKRTDGHQDLYDVTFGDQDIFPVFTYATDPETRRMAYEAYEDHLAVNKAVIERFLGLRRRIAKLLGYQTWADYATELKMVRTANNVEQFLSDLEQSLRPVGLKDLENLLALKKEEHDQRGLPFDGEFYNWDWAYYKRISVERSLQLDSVLLREYFPVATVVPAVLDIYQNLLGVRFVKTEGKTWHPDVQMFAVWEKDEQDSSGFLGYCYLDIYPREYKFPHAACWCPLQGYARADGSRSYPVAVIIANLAKPTPTKPALMRHSDLVMFFHEMGHIFHELLSQTQFSRFHGTTVAIDFGEAPSQMLENFCWEPKVLRLMSSHHETGKPLDDEIIDKILKSRHNNVGLFQLRQVFLAKFDYIVHAQENPGDLTEVWTNMRAATAFTKVKKMCAGQCNFNHLASDDYSVGYYGYLYSLVFSADMYATVFKDDPLDPERGKLYREKILRPGASRDELDVLQDFLGRPPNSEAFVKQLFGTT